MGWLLSQVRSWATAVAFLTQIPLPGLLFKGRQDNDFAAALFWFPAVGAMLGALLGISLLAFGACFGVSFAAALALLVWTWLTGALHLDGLADSVDGFAAGHRDRTRILEVMSDSRIGAHGATALVMALLLKWSALLGLLQNYSAGQTNGYGVLLALVWSLLLARLAAALLVVELPAAKPGGLSALFRRPGSRRAAYLGAALGFVGVTLGVVSLSSDGGVLAGPSEAFRMARSGVGVAVVGLFWGRYLVKQIGGATGDAAGALVEVSELISLGLWQSGLGDKW